MNYYRRLCIGLKDKGKLIPADAPLKDYVQIGSPIKDYYLSIYKYNEEQKQEFDITGSVKGVTDLVVDKLLFDLDSKQHPELARNDAVVLTDKLLNLGFQETDIRIFFSGNKGFHVQIDLTHDLSESEFKSITKQIAGDLESYDIVVSNPSRIVRGVGSVHTESGLYKIPLNLDQLRMSDVDAIKGLARSFSTLDKSWVNWTVAELPDQVKKLKNELKPKPKPMDLGPIDIDFAKKVKGWSNCKWALTQGIEVKAAERHSKLVCIVATARALNNTKEQAYYYAKNAMKLGVKRYGGDECDKEDIGVIVDSVYSDSWQGGTMSCRDGKTLWLTDLCTGLGKDRCKHNEDESCFIEIEDFASKFTDFAVNIDKNTLKLGVPPVDENVMITTSMLVGLLGAPSAGKTSLLLNFLEQSNKDNIDSVFFSMDMGLPLVYLRLIQKHFGIQKDQVFDMFLNDPERVKEIIQTIKDKYALTKFSFRTGMSVEGMRNAVADHQDRTGRKVKLIGVDYLECISGPFSDATANTAMIANQLKDIANDLDVCVMLLLQTQKQSGDPSDPLLSMRNVKGSSVIEQACSVIMSLSRPGFSPLTPENDRFATVSTVKDRMGSLVSMDCGWHGLTGNIFTLADEDKGLLADVRMRKSQEKQAKESW